MKQNQNELSTLFDTKIGTCTISLVLDKRHPAKDGDGRFPLTIRYTINRERKYMPVGDEYTEAELYRISKATGQGEKHNGIETNYEKQVRLRDVFDHYVRLVAQVNETGMLTLERIMTILTGHSESMSFIKMWENIIQEKYDIGKTGTAQHYESAMNSFKQLTGISYSDGFAIDKATVESWKKSMERDELSPTTVGIYLRTIRIVVNRSISDGYMMPKTYMFGKGHDTIKIPQGKTRRERFLTKNEWTELWYHWKNRDIDLPIANTRKKDSPKYAVKTEKDREEVYRSLGILLMMYLGCGCNLCDLAYLTYNDFYFDNHQQGFRFIRRKTEDETLDGEGIEVIIPITGPIREILDTYAARPEQDALVFPFLMGHIISIPANTKEEKKAKAKLATNYLKELNKQLGKRVKKVALSLGWTVEPSSTYSRHSFATVLHQQRVPLEYITDAMGHSINSCKVITIRYISPYSLEERNRYNVLLLDLQSSNSNNDKLDDTSAKKTSLMDQIAAFSVDDIKAALIFLKKRELERLEAD